MGKSDGQTDGQRKMMNLKVSCYSFSITLARNEYPSIKAVWNGPSGIVRLAPNFNPEEEEGSSLKSNKST